MSNKEREIAAALSEHGYKLTSQRLAVVHAIAHAGEHVTPAVVYSKICQHHPTIGLTTVYRTLEILARAGFIDKVHLGGNCHSYTVKERGHHHHLICSDCGKVVDFAGCDLSELENSLSQQTGFRLKSHLLEFLGRCPDCQRAASA